MQDFNFKTNGLPTNGFDVEFKGLEILTGTVCQIAFFGTKTVEFVILDHTIPVDGEVDMPVVQHLKECEGGKVKFCVEIKHLTSDGDVAYREKLEDCVIEVVERGVFDCNNKGNATIRIVVAFDKQEFNVR